MKNLFTTIDDHAERMYRMADTTDVDFAVALTNGTLSPEGFRQAVMSCCGCRNPDACKVWLDKASGDVNGPPEYCKNHMLFTHLKSESLNGL